MESENMIIPSVTNLKYLKRACKSNSPIVLLSNTDMGVLKSQIDYVHKFQKMAFAHLELIGGFNPDTVGIRLLKNMYGLDGVFTTNVQAGNIAKSINLKVVYRFFLIDSRSIKRTAEILRKSNFDAIETLPAYCAIEEFDRISKIGLNGKFIAGGFIKEKEMIDKIFKSGISGVTTSCPDLWN